MKFQRGRECGLQESSKQNYLHGAAMMTAGVVVIKILGAIYKIPLGNILGDEGYGYFSVAYNIYYVFLNMATAGMPVALSRMISEADTLGRPVQARKIFRVAWLTFAIFGLLLGLVMFLFPTELAGMLNNVRAAQSIWALSPALVLVYLTSTYRGYAQGMSNMKPTTVSQILEVVGKVAVGLVLAWSFTRAGKSLPVASAGAIFGVTAGGAFALIYVAIYYHRHYPEKPVADPDVPDSAGHILVTLLRISIPIALGSSVLSIINLVDTKLIMYRLQTALGSDYLVTEEGLSGRTTVFVDPIHESMDALSVAYSLLKSHEGIDRLIIMLGTNDVKERFNANAACIGAGMERLILKAKSVDCWGTKAPNILIVAPPRIGDGFHDAVMGEGCVEKSKGVAEQFRIVAERQNVHFLNAADCEFNQVDFMHLTRKGHAQLAELLAKEVPGLI